MAEQALVKRTKALCHPNRKAVTGDGLCSACFVAQIRETQPNKKELVKLRHMLVDLHKDAEYVKHLAKQAEAIVQSHLPDYAELHFEGAQVAALEGNTKPAEWALTHIKPGKDEKPIIEPQAKEQGPDSSVRVFVGVKVAGLADTHTEHVIDAERVPQEDE